MSDNSLVPVHAPAAEKADELTPRQIVERLDQYIIGQEKAKRAVAVALRNRMRRLWLPEEIRDEVAPKNILMIGPTGVGKTEIVRRLAKLCRAPFLKVEATKYTEVGYVGRDVESMVRDLMAVGFKDVKAEMEDGLRGKSAGIVEEKLLDLLLPGSGGKKGGHDSAASAARGDSAEKAAPPDSGKDSGGEKNSTREKFRAMLRDGLLEEREVELNVRRQLQMPGMEIIAGGNIEDLESSMQNLANMISGGRNRRRTVSVREARRILTEQTLDSLIDMDKVTETAKSRVEQSGIIVIDEIDKIAVRGESHGQDVSREGVQRDILPIVEGSSVNTKYGVVDTTHILFIAAGAFSVAAPSDLIPELQGRFPLRVELDSLHKEEFRRILLEPKNSLVRQYIALLETEGVTLKFTDDAIDRMSFIAEDVNSRSENIGARRLHTIMEKVLDEISFSADEHRGETVTIDSAYVDSRLQNIVTDTDLSRYVL